MKRSILTTAIALYCAVPVHAATSTWNSAISGNWGDAANWNPSTFFPNNGNGGLNYDAIINATGANYTVTLNSNITVDSVTLNSANATLSHTAGMLTSTLTTLTTGTLNVNGGTISGGVINVGPAGTLSFGTSTASTLTGVTVNGDLSLTAGSARLRIGAGTTFNTAHLANSSAELGFLAGATMDSTILFEGVGFGNRLIAMNSAGALTIGSTGVVRTATGFGGSVSLGIGQQFNAAMALSNQGLISSQVSGRTITINPATSFTNSGIIEATNGGVLTISPATWSNTGNLRALTGGTANLSGAWSNLGGTITADATSTLNLDGSFSTPNLGTLTLAAGSTVNIAGTWNNSGQTFTFNAATGSWTLAGGTISGGTVNFADGASLLVNTSAANLLTGVTVNGDLSLTAGSARLRIGAGTTFNTAHLANSSAELGFLAGATMDSTILFEGVGFGNRLIAMNSAGALTIGSTGVVRTATGFGGSVSLGIGQQFNAAMALSNQGLISSQVSGRTITINPATSFTNSGIIEATNGGVLTISPATWSNTGNLRALTGGTANLSGAWSNLGGTITADATSTLNLDGSFSTPNLGTLTLAAGSTVNIAGTWNNSGQTFTFNAATGSWTLAGGTISGGTVNFADGASLLVNTSAANLLTGVTVNGDLSLTAGSARLRIGAGTTFNTAHLANSSAELGFLAGATMDSTILFEGVGFGNRLIAMNSAGALTIGSTGVVRTATGFGGSVSLGIGQQFNAAMALSNQGLISSQVSGRTITINPATSFTNSGIIEATNGGVLTISPATWSNTGNLRALTGGTANLSGAWSNLGGTITADATSTLNLDGSFSTPNLGTLTLAAGSTVNIAGTWNNSGQTFTFNAATGSWTLAGGTISGGTVNFADGASLLVNTSAANLLTGVTVNGDLSLTAGSARLRIGAGTTFNTAHLANSSAELGFLAGATMDSTILFEGVGFGNRLIAMNSAGALTIGSTGVVRTATGFGGSVSLGIGQQFNAAMALSNQGLISSQVSGRTITINPATSFTNSGIIEATNGGVLTISPATWSNTGNLRALTGGTANLSGAWSNLGGTITADATSTLNLDGSFSTPNLGTLTLAAGSTVNIAGTWNNSGQTFTFNAATGSWTLAGGTISGGTVNFADGASLLVNTSAANLLTGVTVNGDLSLTAGSARLRIGAGTTFNTAHLANSSAELGFLAGATMDSTILFEGVGFGNRLIAMNSAGALTIGSTGVVRTATGFGGSVSLGIGQQFNAAMALSNQGLISSQVSGRTITINPATSFTNSGIIEATNGGVLTVIGGYTQTAGVTRLDNGTLNVTDSGAAILTATLSGGRLEGRGTINGRVVSSAIIAPGLPAGALNILNDLTISGTSAMEFEIGGITQGTQYDYLAEAGTLPLNLDGNLSLKLISGFVPSPGDTFTIIHSNANLGPGLFDNIAPGDRLAITDGLGSFVVNYGTGSPDVVLTNFLIPEPGTGALALLGLSVLIQRRRRR